MFRTRPFFLAFLFILLFALPDAALARQETTGARNVPAAQQPERDPRWAVPYPLPGLPNLHKVDEKLYRSAQPEKNSLPSLQTLGVKTVISLRKTDKDSALLKDSGIEPAQLGVNTWSINDAVIIANLRAIRAAQAKGPVLVHCRHGADRTGLTIAMYRMVVQDWSREDARREMLEGGYGFHSIWKNITNYIDTVNIAVIKTAVMQ